MKKKFYGDQVLVCEKDLRLLVLVKLSGLVDYLDLLIEYQEVEFFKADFDWYKIRCDLNRIVNEINDNEGKYLMEEEDDE